MLALKIALPDWTNTNNMVQAMVHLADVQDAQMDTLPRPPNTRQGLNCHSEGQCPHLNQHPTSNLT